MLHHILFCEKLSEGTEEGLGVWIMANIWPLWSSLGLEMLRTWGRQLPMSRSFRVSSFMKYGSYDGVSEKMNLHFITTGEGSLWAAFQSNKDFIWWITLTNKWPSSSTLTLILLSFFWILCATWLVQYFSLRKSQKILPTRAFIQLGCSSVGHPPAPEPTLDSGAASRSGVSSSLWIYRGPLIRNDTNLEAMTAINR